MMKSMILEDRISGGFDVMFYETETGTDDYSVHADFLNEAWEYVKFQEELHRQMIANLRDIEL